MKCPNCGIDEPIKGEYCIHCGSNLELTPERRSKEGEWRTTINAFSDWLADVCERCGGSWIADYALGSTYHCDTCGNRRDEENPHKHEWLTLPHGATCKLCGLEIYDGTDDGG